MNENRHSSLEEQLVQALTGLADAALSDQKRARGRAALAALRRGLGHSPGSVPEIYQHVPVLARFSNRTEGDALLVAALFGLHPCEWTDSERRSAPTRTPQGQNFGTSLALLASALNRHQRRRADPSDSSPDGPPNVEEQETSAGTAAQPGVERRLVALLSADHEDVGEHLRPFMGLLRQHNVPVNWLQLLRDLENWESVDRRVQRNWARSYWGRANTASGQSAPTGA